MNTVSIEIVKRRTSMSDDDAVFYTDMASSRIASYLDIAADFVAESADYTFAIADIATLYYQLDNSIKNTAGSLGLASESFSEGSVSESHSYIDSSTITTDYDARILDVLNNISNKGKVRFL